MITVIGVTLLTLVFAYIFPAYSSYKALKSKNIRACVKWMVYWIVYSLYSSVEFIPDIFLSFWFPFYYEFKILFILWLIYPQTNGARFLFKTIINPYLNKYEKAIDSNIASLRIVAVNSVHSIGAQQFAYLRGKVWEYILKAQFIIAGLLTESLSASAKDSRDTAEITNFDPSDAPANKKSKSSRAIVKENNSAVDCHVLPVRRCNLPNVPITENMAQQYDFEISSDEDFHSS